MNIFILGKSGVGKTPLAKHLAEVYHMNYVKASEYFRSTYHSKESDRNKFIQGITTYSQKELSNNYRVNIDYLSPLHNSVIEGIRNPIDFSNLFDFNKDIAIFLNTQNELLSTSFENGIYCIQSILKWSVSQNITPSDHVISYSFDSFYGKENSLEYIIKELSNGTLRN